MTRKKRKLLIGMGAAVIIIAAGVGAYAYWYGNIPDPETAQPEEITAYLASDEFASLTVEKKQQYIEKVHNTSDGPPHRMMQSAEKLDEKTREKLHENMGSLFRARMEQRINHYFELPAEQRTAYLDEMIDQHENRGPPPDEGKERKAEGNSNDRRRGPGGRRGRPSKSEMHEHHKRMLKHTSGREQARRRAFMEAMRKRRKERGLPEHHGPPH